MQSCGHKKLIGKEINSKVNMGLKLASHCAFHIHKSFWDLIPPLTVPY